MTRTDQGRWKETTVRSVLSWSPFPFTHPRPFHLRYAPVLATLALRYATEPEGDEGV